MNDWDRLLDLAGYQSGSAQDLFTNRFDELTAFRRSIDVHQHALRTTPALAERTLPRTNVLVFCGKGGVGKTSLSWRLESWLTGGLGAESWWGAAADVDGLATVRLDLHASLGFFDVDALMVEIREQLGETRDSWPAFDYAFAICWAAHHRNEPMPVGSQRHGRLRTASDLATSELGRDAKPDPPRRSRSRSSHRDAIGDPLLAQSRIPLSPIPALVRRPGSGNQSGAATCLGPRPAPRSRSRRPRDATRRAPGPAVRARGRPSRGCGLSLTSRRSRTTGPATARRSS